MATFPEEFIDLADELINDEFAAFKRPIKFSLVGSYNPVTGVTTEPTVDDVNGIRLEYRADQIDDNRIQANDYMLVIKATEFSNLTPAVTGVKVELDGRTINLVHAAIDAANAVWTLQVRG